MGLAMPEALVATQVPEAWLTHRVSKCNEWQ